MKSKKFKKNFSIFAWLFLFILLVVNITIIFPTNSIAERPLTPTQLVRDGDKMHCEEGGSKVNCGPISARFWN
jgi:hypothetical protein